MTPEATEAVGVTAISVMVSSYALERRHRIFVAIFAVGCALAAVYALLIESYPFLIAESVWCVIATRRWYTERDLAPSTRRT